MENIETTVKNLLEKTKTGKVLWDKLTSNSFRWSRKMEDSVYVTTIKSQSTQVYTDWKMVRVQKYTLTVQKRNPTVIILQIDGKKDNKINQMLGEIYGIAKNKVWSKWLEIFDELLNGL